MRTKNLHVCTLNKFIPPFWKMVQAQFSMKDQKFWIKGDFDQYPMPDSPSIYKARNGTAGLSYLKLAKEMNLADKIILHGLFDIRIVLLLWMMPWIHAKCYWVLWGGDLYVKRNGPKNLRWKIKEFFKAPIIKNLRAIITTVPGDYDLARKWYKTKADFIHSLMYGSHVARRHEVKNKKNPNIINIQIGNSADPENRHAEAFHMIQDLIKDRVLNIYCPLSYGDQRYAQETARIGREMFGSYFNSMTRFMTFDEYNKYLSSVDVAIFNHRRQQAMGNIVGLLSMGKTVYLRPSETPFQYFKKLGIVVRNIEDIGCGIYLLSDEEVKNNVTLMQDFFSEEKLVQSWEAIFRE